MGKLLIGLAIALLDFPVQLAGGRVLDLTPDVLGYIIMVYGIRQIGKHSSKFSSAYKVSWFAAIASGVYALTNLLFGQNNMSMVIILLGIAEMILQIVLLVYLAAGFADVETTFGVGMQSKWLKITAIGLATGTVLGYAGLVLPGLEMAGGLVVDILHFVYLILFYFAREAYQTVNTEE